MKRKITTTALLVAFALLALFIPEKTILPKAVAENIDAPKLEVIEGVYNMAVKYMWRVGRGGDTLTLSTSSAIYAPIDDVYYEEYAFPNFFSSYKECTPHYTHAKSYSYSTGTYSEETSNGIDILISDGVYRVAYGRPAKFTPVGGISERDYYKNMPTDWDQPGFVWSHGGAYANYIKATILYKGVISDIQVKIPLMGTYKESVILNGVTFNIRTGPNKCSITVDKSNVRAGEVQFAFGIGSK